MLRSSLAFLLVLTLTVPTKAADVIDGATVNVATPIAGTKANGKAKLLGADANGNLLVSSGGAGATAAAQAEVLVIHLTATTMGGLSGRRGMEIQNLGPNDIYCTPGGVPVLYKARKVSALGGVWALDVAAGVVVKCIADVADQVTTAATIVTELGS